MTEKPENPEEFCYGQYRHCKFMKDNKCKMDWCCPSKLDDDPCLKCSYFVNARCTCQNEEDCPEWEKTHDSEVLV